MQHLQCQMRSFWNFLQRISETGASTGSVWVTPRWESIYLAVKHSKCNKEKKVLGFFFLLLVSPSEAFLGVHQTSMQQMCYLFQGKLIHFSLKLCRMQLLISNGLQCKEFSFSGNLTQWEGSEPRYNTLVHKNHYRAITWCDRDSLRQLCDFPRDSLSSEMCFLFLVQHMETTGSHCHPSADTLYRGHISARH